MKKSASDSTPFPAAHLLQSETWEQYEQLEGHQTFRLDGPNYTILAVLHPTPLGNYLFCPYGPSAATKTGLQNALRALTKLADEKNATFIRIEPTQALEAPEMAKIAQKLGYSIKKSHDLDPAHTWILDLDTPTDTLLANMESRKARYWRNHQKKGISLRTTQDPEQITILTNFLKNLGEIDNFTPQDETHLKNQLKSGFATLYIADLTIAADEEGATDAVRARTAQSIPIAAALIYDYGDTRYYAHAATDFEHRKLAAGSIILIQMILDAKQNGAKFYDFWGITTSEDPKHPWYGFTQYKKSFGGRQVDYAGTYDLILKPLRYRLYQLLRRLNRWRRKLLK